MYHKDRSVHTHDGAMQHIHAGLLQQYEHIYKNMYINIGLLQQHIYGSNATTYTYIDLLQQHMMGLCNIYIQIYYNNIYI